MAEFDNYLSPGRKGHLIGIGGVSMSSLAEVLQGMGIVVTGSDMNDGANVESLRSKGIEIRIGHRAENIAPDVEFVVRTAAVHDDNPEIMAARARGIPVFERTQAWGAISKDYANALCICGTHGKTTTTSMCTHIMMAADKDPTVMIGGTLPLLKAGHRVGHGSTIIMEACEYYNSFLSFHPTVAVVLNIEADHLDFFKDLDDVKHSFHEFASRVPADGYVVANLDDKNTMDVVKDIKGRVITFGLSDKADVTAKSTLVTELDYSEALDNHHAFLIDREKNLIAFPADDQYVIYGYDTAKGFYPQASLDLEGWSWNTRGLYVDDMLYVVGDEAITVISLDGFKPVKTVDISVD